MSESAFNDAMGAIVTFTVLGVAMGSGEFSVGGCAERAAQAIRDRYRRLVASLATRQQC